MSHSEPSDGAARPAPRSGASPRPSVPVGAAAPPGDGSGGRRRRGARRGAEARRGGRNRMRTVDETSAGGLVVDGLDGPPERRCAALIGRTDRRGRMLWSLPKGHLEQGETAEQAAVREIAEETGIDGAILAPLGSIDYWFVTEGRRVHKTVHHFLLRFLGGELSDLDPEVTEVAWVPLSEMGTRLAYADERRLVRAADDAIVALGRSTSSTSCAGSSEADDGQTGLEPGASSASSTS